MNSNRILKQITYEIYKKRPFMPRKYRTNYRIERANGGFLCDLWFLTVGCIHDAQGGCVMCNYGKGCHSLSKAEQLRILQELRGIVDKLPWTFEDFLLTPSGSMLDEREVPQDMREQLIPILQKVRTKRLIIETRAATVTEDGLQFFKGILPGTEKYIEIGLESSDDWILKHCINKNSTFADFCSAVELSHAHGIFVTANVGLGFPFMSERASIRSTIQTVRDALEAGADSVVLFPYHIKRGTLLDVMKQNHMYHCVSLWALVQVLESFPEDLDKIQISWYKDYFGEDLSYIYSSPTTCPRCGAAVLEELDRFRESQDRASIDRLRQYPCRCRAAWEAATAAQSETIELELVEQSYRQLSSLFSVDQGLLERELEEMKREYGEMAKL